MMKLETLLAVLGTATLMAQSYIIKGPENPKPYEATAMKEMTDYLARRIGDNSLVIGGNKKVTFQIGDTALAKEQNCLSTQLEDERWVIKSVGDQVLINGGGTRGALYATYHFLEDFCDIHWWSDYEDYVPATSSMTLDALDATGKPVFLYRDIYRSDKGPMAPYTAVRARLNRDGGEGLALQPLELGGSFAYGNPGHCHTFDRYVPYQKYGKVHPEYFSLRNGKRIGGQTGGQLCLSNKEFRQMFLEQLMNFIESDRKKVAEKGLLPARIYDVSMNDNWGKCECEQCLAEEAKYNPSGHYLNFVNWIASEVSKKYPDIYISTLAYFYTEPPPKGGVRAADNVIVKLCDTRTNQAASILEPCNKVFYDFLTSWKGFAKNLFIWDYAITFTRGGIGLPFASEFHYGDLYRTYHENNVTGVFWEHERPHLADMYELKFFLETKLFEDPYQDVNKLIDLFMDRYYGPAGEFILEYRKMLDADRIKNKAHISWFPAIGNFFYLSGENMVKAQELFDQAEDAVKGDAQRLLRVRHARVGLDKLCCLRAIPLYHYVNGKEVTSADMGLSEKAFERIRDYRNEWVRGWANSENLAEEYNNELPGLTAEIKRVPPPEELAGRSFYDFYADRLVNKGGAEVEKVDDPESKTGKAMRSNVDANIHKHYDLPFTIGVYDTGKLKGINSRQFPKTEGPGYHWYKLSKTRFPESSYIFMTRSWTTQLPVSHPELIGKEFEIWVSVKFTGPKFFEGSQDKNYIYIDRVALVEN